MTDKIKINIQTRSDSHMKQEMVEAVVAFLILAFAFYTCIRYMFMMYNWFAGFIMILLTIWFAFYVYRVGKK